MNRLSRSAAPAFLAGLLMAPLAAWANPASTATDGIWLLSFAEPGYVRHYGFQPEAGTDAPPASSGTPLSPHGAQAARADYLQWLAMRRQDFLQEAGELLGRTLEPRQVLVRSRHAMSLELAAGEGELLGRLEAVRSIRPVERFILQSSAAPQAAWPDFAVPAFEEWWNPPIETGAGTVIGVIDTLIDPTTPQLESWDFQFSRPLVNPRGRYYGLCAQDPGICNYSAKVIGMYDFGGGLPADGAGYNHGTLVASVAAGVRAPIYLHHDGGWPDLHGPGQAPYASLISYGACTPAPVWDQAGSCSEDLVLAAMEQAAADRVDVLLFAAGGRIRDPWKDLLSEAPSVAGMMLELLLHDDIVTVAAAGNTGPAPGTTTYPANAPWVLSVGGFEGTTRLHSIFGLGMELGGEFISRQFQGVSMTPSYPPRFSGMDNPQVRRGADLAHPACAIGPKLDVRHCGTQIPESGNPFPPGSFDGEIVICENHDYSPIQVSENLARAGAGGMVLVNTRQDQDASMAFRSHCLPSVHLDRESGRLIELEFGSALAAGGLVHGGIGVTGWQDSDLWWGSEIWSSDSARGPDGFTPGVAIPRGGARGSDVLAARTQDPGEFFVDVTQHSSVAAATIAGTVARVRAARPRWSATQVLSAVTSGDTLRDAHTARQQSLILPVDDFAGGPAGLNAAHQIKGNCFDRCRFSWTLEAAYAGTWRVWNLSSWTEVSPQQFTLRAGERVTLNMLVEPQPSVLDLNQWHGATLFVLPEEVHWEDPADFDFSASSTTLKAEFFLPALTDASPIRLGDTGNQDRHQHDFLLPAMVEFPEFSVSAAVNAHELAAHLPPLAEPRSSDPLGIHEAGSRVFWLEVPADSPGLWVELTPASAEAGRILVGRAGPGGAAVQAGTRCITPNPKVRRSCLVENPEPGRWWVAVQNAHGQVARNIAADAYVFGPESGNSFVHAPGVPGSGRVTANMGWDGSGLRPGKIGMLIAYSDNISTLPRAGVLARVPVFARIPALPPESPIVLMPHRPARVYVEANTTRSGVFVDVPPTATRMEVEIRGGPVQAALRHLPLSAIAGFAPGTPPMPAGSPAATASGSAFTLSLNGPVLTPGRWYLELAAGAEGRLLDIEVRLAESGRIEPLTQLWNPASRSTNQGVSWQEAGPGFIVWYTYEEDSTPVFYMAIGDIEPASSVWTGDLIRVSGRGQDQFVNRVGTASITAFAPDDLVFSWHLKGKHGSERKRPAGPETCPTLNGKTTNLMGHWSFGGRGIGNGGGLTTVFTDSVQAHVFYFFDDQGEPRWVIAAGDGIRPEDRIIPILSFTGFCPYCTPFQPARTTAGTLRTFFTGQGILEQDWTFTVPYTGQRVIRPLHAKRFSVPKPCQ